MSAGVDTDRCERFLKRAIIMRDANAKNMKLLFELSKKAETDEEFRTLFRVRMRDLESVFIHFNTEQSNIIDTLIDLGREQEYQTKHTDIETLVNEQYYFVKAIAEVLIPVVPTSVELPKTERLRIQLPNIQIPKFDGDILQWSVFRDMFSSLVHDNTNLSNMERFHYLLTAVSGSASSVVRSIPLSDANYPIAWNALHERYDNQRLIMNAHLDKLFSFSPLRSSTLADLKYFLYTFQENIAALNTFNVPDKVGFLLFFIASRVLDPETKCLFESENKSKEIPVINDLINFVKTRCHVLQNSISLYTQSSSNQSKPSTSTKKPSTFIRNSLFVSSPNSAKSCPVCQKPHYIYKCDTFLKFSPAKRLKIVQANRVCSNCLSTSHTHSACASKYTCRTCAAQHHSLLNLDINEQKSPPTTGVNDQLPTTSSQSNNASTAFVGTASSMSSCVVGTAVIRVRDKFGEWIPMRALIDSGSQISAVTQSCAAQLGLSRRPSRVAVVGLAQIPVAQPKGVISCRFIPHSSTSPTFICEAFILSKITGTLPRSHLNPIIRSSYSDLNYADPAFDHPARIDCLLGADIYNQIFEDGYRIRHTPGLPSAFETTLGWIVMGANSQCTSPSKSASFALTSGPSLDRILHQFWSMEEPTLSAVPTTEDRMCEKWFTETTSRDDAGRFSVALPFRDVVHTHEKENTNDNLSPEMVLSPNHGLGDSRRNALKRLYNLESRLNKDPKLYEAYRKFMSDYLVLGYMKLATRPGKYFIPHHAIVKQDGDVAKIRVVFDASAPSSSGASLNDVLCVGPKLQTEISDILLRCRLSKYVFIADIEKMYRQILVRPEDCEYQHILWRSSSDHEVLEYELLTVTYGVSTAPYLTIRCLHELDVASERQFPAAKGILANRTYVDDIVAGADTEEELLRVQEHVIGLLGSACCVLKKWASNSNRVLDRIPLEDRAQRPSFDAESTPSIKVLGLHWDPYTDAFGYHTSIQDTKLTKRGVLSTIARVFDPIGALGPTLLWAKSFMQQLWLDKFGWDTPLAPQLRASWEQFISELPSLANIALLRHIDVRMYKEAQLLGFADASQIGYAATTFLRVTYNNNDIRVYFLTGKTKVAPLKTGESPTTLTIPRLELCAALLLAQLLQHLIVTLSSVIEIAQIRAWTDSSIVLSWLTADQSYLKFLRPTDLPRYTHLFPIANGPMSLRQKIPRIHRHEGFSPTLWCHVTSIGKGPISCIELKRNGPSPYSPP